MMTKAFPGFRLLALPVVVCLLFAAACQQDPHSPAATPKVSVDLAKVTDLEELGHKFGFTQTDYDNYVHGLHELNAEELEVFNDLELKRSLAIPNLNEADKANTLRMRELKRELNRRTLEMYNKPYNQVEGSKVIPIVEVLDARVKAENGRQASCPYVRKFPSGTTVGSTSKENPSNLANVQKEGDTDCDYQYSFSYAHTNGWLYVIGKTPKARQLLLNSMYLPPLGECRGFEGTVGSRRSGDHLNASRTDYTGGGICLLLGKGRVDMCYNNGWGLFSELGMGI
jgi:hypothetical protein